MSDYSPDIDVDIPKRVNIDVVDNNHGKSLIEFLNDNKMCVLNGRFDQSRDNFTYVANGSSVVDYIICPHEHFTYSDNFEVITSRKIVDKHGLQYLVKNKSKIPDHSMLKMSIIISDVTIPVHTANPSVTPSVQKYKLNNIPNEFMNNDISCQELLDLIHNLELSRETQSTVDKYYDMLLSCIYTEMDKYLPKTGDKCRKSLKIKKPYWNGNLMTLWKEMCKMENTYLKFKGPYHVKQFLRERFSDSSKIFHKALRTAERQYNKKLQDDIEMVCTDNPQKFWDFI